MAPLPKTLIRLLLCVACLTALAAGPQAQVRPHALRCDYLVNPLGLDVSVPGLSWKLEDPRRGATQKAYQIQVGSQPGNADVWDSGKVISDQCVNVAYGGPALASGTRYHWRVRVWDKDGVPTSFSPAAWWETGILNPSHWKAQWIGIHSSAALVRRAFTITKQVKRARVHASARGLYRLRVNGQGIGSGAFTPDWTDYTLRSVYQTYDITSLMKSGENVVGAFLGKGWYGSRLGWKSQAEYPYGPAPMRLFLELHLDFTDNSSTVIISDGSWKGIQGPIQDSTLYDGEQYDARKEEPGWDAPGFDDRHWAAVSAVPLGVQLTAQRSNPIRVIESIRPRSVTSPATGTYVYDLGQNMAGWVRLRVRGQAGIRVRLRFSEVLASSGHLDTYSLRSARATDEYVLRGSGKDEFFEPRFTYHGFRYVEVTGYPGTPGLDDVTGTVVHTDAPMTGAFSCSSDLVNRIWQSTLWSQRGNLFSVPTDCPQRDERLGWTGDAQTFWRTACYNMDLAAFSRKWMLDLEESQSPAGSFRDMAPVVPGLTSATAAPFWGDAGIVIPWTAYRQYGDTTLLKNRYASMQKWMDYILANNANFIWERSVGNNYGDWMAPSRNPFSDKVVIATAVWASNARKMEEIARVLGRVADVAAYEKLYGDIKSAFAGRFVSGSGRVGSGHQTPTALALHADLVPANLIQAAVAELVADITSRGNHLSTGFAGTACLLPVLSEAGRDDIAYKLLLQTTYPSWGYMVNQGGTTIWERWNNDVVCEKRVDPTCSFNHFCFGSVVEWLYRYLAGIDLEPQDAGFRRLRIRPRIGPGLDHVQAHYDSIRGPVKTRWDLHGSDVTLAVTLPPGARAEVHVPAPHPDRVRESGFRAATSPGVRFLRMEAGAAVFETAAGDYVFTVGGLTTEGPPAVGKTMWIHIAQQARAGSLYQVAAAALSAPGIEVPGVGVIPLNPDFLLYMSLSGWFPTVFADFAGRLDSSGEATAALNIPALPELVGLPFSVAGVTYDAGGINYITNGKDLKFSR